MITHPIAPETIDEYIVGFPQNVQQILQKIRLIIREAAPDAVETVKYKIPTYTLKGNLVSFAGYKKHIGLYPVPAGDEAFQKAIAIYRSAKSTARFPLDKPIPFELIGELVQWRVKEHLERAEAKGKKKV